MHRTLLILLSGLVACTHVNRSSDLESRAPAESAPKARVERAPLAMSGGIRKVLVQSIINDRLLTYEICAVDIGALRNDIDVFNYLNAGDAECVHLNDRVFTTDNSNVIDAINQTYAVKVKAFLKAELSDKVSQGAALTLASGVIALANGYLANQAWQGAFDRTASGRAMGKTYLRTTGLIGMFFTALEAGMAGASAVATRRFANLTEPHTLERAVSEYMAQHRVRPSASLPTGESLFDLLTRAMNAATEEVYQRVTTL